MPKYIQKVADLTRKTITNQKGYKSGPYETHLSPENGILLRHYGTIISDSTGKVYEGAYSSSDRDAISTFFEVIGINRGKTVTNRGGKMQLI